MKRVVCLMMVLALAACVNAGYYLAGGFNSWEVAGLEMTDNGDGTYSASLTGLDADTRYEFKVTDGTWTVSYPGANSWLYTDASGAVTVTFDTNVAADGWETSQYRIGVDTDPGTWTLTGGFGDSWDWDNSAAEGAMTAMGSGIYMLSKTLSAGTYYWKTVMTGSWDSISADGRSINTGNAELVLTEDAVVNFYVDAINGTVKAEVIPEPATMALLGLGALVMRRRRR